jgi:hypothetical protein
MLTLLSHVFLSSSSKLWPEVLMSHCQKECFYISMIMVFRLRFDFEIVMMMIASL